jgi:DNA-binding transcriptional LysR family regulator
MGTAQSFNQWSLVKDGLDEPPVRVTVQGRLVANSMQILKSFCLAGHGIGLIDLKAAEDAQKQGALVRVLPPWRSVGSPLHLVTASRLGYLAMPRCGAA